MKHLEDTLQTACITWIRLQYPDVVCFAIPNGGKRNAIEAAKLKRTGTLAGVADLFVMCIHRSAGKLYHGLFIELKIGKNKLTPDQELFRLNAISAGYGHVVCRSIDEFIYIVNEYLKC